MKPTSTADFVINLRILNQKSQVELKIYITHLTLKKTLKKINGTLNFFWGECLDYFIIHHHSKEKGKPLMNKNIFTDIYNFTWPNLNK